MRRNDLLSTELVIVRHPQAQCEVAGIVGGRRGDTGLTPEGRALAASTAIEMLREQAEQPYSVVYTGGQPRLRETAKIVAAVLGVRMLGEAALACHRYGYDIDARPWAEVIAELGGSPRALPDRNLGQAGESTTKCLLRLRSALERLTSRHPGQRVVVIGDSAHVDASLLLFLGGSQRSEYGGGSECAPGGITRWREQPDPGQIQASGLGWRLVHHGRRTEVLT
jgi:probable phosphoglycerate mutase